MTNPNPTSLQSEPHRFDWGPALWGTTLIIIGITIRFHIHLWTGAVLYTLGWLLVGLPRFSYFQQKKILIKTVLASSLGSLLVACLWFVRFHSTPMPLVACSVLVSKLCSPAMVRESTTTTIMASVSSVVIIVAEYYILPFQRANSITDGVGLPLLISGLTIITSV